MTETESTLREALLILQLCLGFWQIVKLTPFGGFIKGFMGWWMSLLPLGLGTLLSPTYSRLRDRPGRVFKEMWCMTFHPTDYFGPPFRDNMPNRLQWRYLNVDYDLERQENKLFINGKMSYYVTDRLWFIMCTMVFMEKDSERHAVMVKGYRKFWRDVATAGVMSLSEILDCLILEDQIMAKIPEALVLPVDLTVSEEKLLKALNFVGLFLQTKKQIHWLIPILLSFVAAVLEFSTPLRVWIYGKVNKLFCRSVQLICDRLSYSIRRQVYSLGEWVENLRPTNQIEMRIVRGNIRAVIGGGAKANKEGAVLVQPPAALEEDAHSFQCGPIRLYCNFRPIQDNRGECEVMKTSERQLGALDSIHRFQCDRDQFLKVATFVSSLANNRTGSLKSCGPHNLVRVRELRKSFVHFVNTEFPPVYELRLEKAVIM